MKENPLMKKCDVCKADSTALCIKCMLYFCESCFKLAHKCEETKSHIKEKLDYFCPIDIKCPFHKTHPLDLFCVDEKGKLIIIIHYFSIMLFFMCF